MFFFICLKSVFQDGEPTKNMLLTQFVCTSGKIRHRDLIEYKFFCLFVAFSLQQISSYLNCF